MNHEVLPPNSIGPYYLKQAALLVSHSDLLRLLVRGTATSVTPWHQGANEHGQWGFADTGECL